MGLYHRPPYCDCPSLSGCLYWPCNQDLQLFGRRKRILLCRASQRKMKNPADYSDDKPERSLSGCEAQKWRMSRVRVGREEARKWKAAWGGENSEKEKQAETNCRISLSPEKENEHLGKKAEQPNTSMEPLKGRDQAVVLTLCKHPGHGEDWDQRRSWCSIWKYLKKWAGTKCKNQ